VRRTTASVRARKGGVSSANASIHRHPPLPGREARRYLRAANARPIHVRNRFFHVAPAHAVGSGDPRRSLDRRSGPCPRGARRSRGDLQGPRLRRVLARQDGRVDLATSRGRRRSWA
jgi:hypothetical protein